MSKIYNHTDKKWKVLSSEYISRRPWLTVRRDRVELPNGNIHPEYYVLEYPVWVNIIATTNEGKMVLVRQYRHALGETRYELCAGCVEDGETPEQGARRELAEETGYTGGEWSEFMVLSPNSSSTNNLSHTFIARGVTLTEGQHLDKTEDIEVHLLDPEEVFEMLCDGEIIQASMAAPLWKYFYGLKR